MLTRDDFVAQYRSYTDEQLLQIHRSDGSYAKAAIEAADIIIAERGGPDALAARINEQRGKAIEIDRLRQETTEVYRPGTDEAFIQTLVPAGTLSPEEQRRVVAQRYTELDAEYKDGQIKPKTLIGCLIGGGLGSLIGGILLGIQMVQVDAVFHIFTVGTALISYLFIKAITKQSRYNPAVLIASFLSVPAAYGIGYLILGFFG